MDSPITLDEAKKGIINPIPKDNTLDPIDPMSYRGITLACAMYKLYCGVLNSRLVAWAEENGLIEDEQHGFRADRSCVDHLSSLTNIIETQKLFKQSTFKAFIHFIKAFDRINSDFLWLKLKHLGLPSKMLNAIKAIYNDVSCCVRINGVKNSLLQCIFSA